MSESPFFSDTVVHNRERYLSCSRAAAFAGCSTAVITKRIKDGSLRDYKLPRSGRMKFLKEADITALIERGELALSHPGTFRSWTDDEVETLSNTDLTHSEAAFILGRPKDSIASKRRALGIRTGRSGGQKKLVAA